jgi:uncharacterized membrane protein
MARGWTNSIAYAVSGDGSVVVGRGYSGAYDPYTHEAFRWTQATGLERLGFIPCNDWSIAHAVTADGSIIVGDPETNQGDCAFIWDRQRGIRRLHEVLTDDYGLDLSGWQLSAARGISKDGNTIVGYGLNPAGQLEAWIATGLRPALTIRRTNDQCRLSWPMTAADFLLQSRDNLDSEWINVDAPVSNNGVTATVMQTASGTMRFYRLAK